MQVNPPNEFGRNPVASVGVGATALQPVSLIAHDVIADTCAPRQATKCGRPG